MGLSHQQGLYTPGKKTNPNMGASPPKEKLFVPSKVTTPAAEMHRLGGAVCSTPRQLHLHFADCSGAPS